MPHESPPLQSKPGKSGESPFRHSPLDDYYAELGADAKLTGAEANDKLRAGGQRPDLAVTAVFVLMAMLLFNLVSVPIGSSLDGPGMMAIPLAFGVGGYFTQAAFLACGLVFCRFPFWPRLTVHWMLAVLLLGVWLLGFQFDQRNSGPDKDDIWFILMSLPLFGLAVQLPLWGLQQYLNWQIVVGAGTPKPSRPLAISDLMFATLIVAASFAAARSQQGAGQSEFWVIWLIVFSVATGVSMLSIPPLLYCTLGVRDPGWGLLAIFGHVVVCCLIAIALLYAFEPSSRRQVWELLIIPSAICGYATMFTIILWVARVCGCRLVIGQKNCKSN